MMPLIGSDDPTNPSLHGLRAIVIVLLYHAPLPFHRHFVALSCVQFWTCYSSMIGSYAGVLHTVGTPPS